MCWILSAAHRRSPSFIRQPSSHRASLESSPDAEAMRAERKHDEGSAVDIPVAVPIAAAPRQHPRRPVFRPALRPVGCRESGAWFPVVVILVLIGFTVTLVATSAESIGAYIPLIVTPVLILTFAVIAVWMRRTVKRIHRRVAEGVEGAFVVTFGEGGDDGYYHGGVVGDDGGVWDGGFGDGFGDSGGFGGGYGDFGGGGGDSGGGDSGGGGGDSGGCGGSSGD